MALARGVGMVLEETALGDLAARSTVMEEGMLKGLEGVGRTEKRGG